MFAYCDNLKNALLLPATNLVDNCYNQMFCYCSNLKISEEEEGGGDEKNKIFTCPTTTGLVSPVSGMFSNTDPTGFDETPEDGKTYYWVDKD